MAEVMAGENESFESLLRRFNKKVQQGGILTETRRREDSMGARDTDGLTDQGY